MNNSGGALLTEVYGSDSIKVKKKDALLECIKVIAQPIAISRIA